MATGESDRLRRAEAERFTSSAARRRSLRAVRAALAALPRLRDVPAAELDEMARQVVRRLADEGLQV